MSGGVFKETQTYRGTWIMYLMMMTEIPTLILVTVILLNSSEDISEAIIHLAIIFSIMAVAFTLLMTIKLDVRLDHKGIHYKYSPFINKWRLIAKSDIISIEVIKYAPISDYRGWGLKGNKTTKAYSVIGDMGILLDVGEEKKIMIGTQRGSELSVFVENWKEGN